MKSNQVLIPQPTGFEAAVNSEAHARGIIALHDVRFSWNNGRKPVLDIDMLTINRGERVFIEGPSGSGKSTLLNLLAGVVTPREGTVTVLGRRIDTMTGAQRDRFRADHIGFIFQMFNLIPYLSVIENVTLPCRFSQLREERILQHASSADAEAVRLLTYLDMADPDVMKRPVTELSVGQQQRVAAARALSGAPEVVIADEPTSSLDSGHRETFIRLLFEECERGGATLIFVSHDTSLASHFDRTVRLADINRAGMSKVHMITERANELRARYVKD